LREERCLPAGVRGPVECWELARLISARESGSWVVPLFVVVELVIGWPFCYLGSTGLVGSKCEIGGRLLKGKGERSFRVRHSY
jgi:hypothetical protein